MAHTRTGTRNEVKEYPYIPIAVAAGVASYTLFPFTLKASFISRGRPRPTPKMIKNATGTNLKLYVNSFSDSVLLYLEILPAINKKHTKVE